MDSSGPAASSDPLSALLGPPEILISEPMLRERVRQMAEEICKAYQGCEKLVIIGILKGSFVFLADLARHLEMPCQIEFVRLSSYQNAATSSGKVSALDLALPSLAGQHVLVVEDIVDTGLTLSYFMEMLAADLQVNSLRLAVLLDKPAARRKPVRVDFTGFTLENDEFVVGYGLDLAGYYRNLPYIGVIRQTLDVAGS